MPSIIAQYKAELLIKEGEYRLLSDSVKESLAGNSGGDIEHNKPRWGNETVLTH
jgi:hypothetical protein